MVSSFYLKMFMKKSSSYPILLNKDEKVIQKGSFPLIFFCLVSWTLAFHSFPFFRKTLNN